MPHWDLLRFNDDASAELRQRSDAEWEALVPQLIEHGIGGQVYSQLGKKIPAPVASSLKAEWQSQCVRNLVYLDELEWIAEQCGKEGLGATVLKGAALLGEIYEDVGARSMADVDLWVSSDHWDPIVRLLRSRGYSILDETKWEANSFKLNLARWESGMELTIELHQRLFYCEGSDMLWRKEPFRANASGHGALEKLAKEELLAHLMGHLAYQHTFLKLSWLVDIDRLLRKHEGSWDWDRVLALCESLGQKRSASATLWACHRYLGTEIDPSFARKLSRLGTGIWDKIITEEFLWMPTRSRAHYYLVKHLVKDTLAESIRYDLLWLRRKAWK